VPGGGDQGGIEDEEVFTSRPAYRPSQQTEVIRRLSTNVRGTRIKFQVHGGIDAWFAARRFD
jgi:hypothetical protein